MEPDLFCADRLTPDAMGRVIEISASGMLRLRLFDLGVVPGALICRRYTAPAGSPIAFDIQGAMVALRKSDAASIMIQEVRESWTP